MTNFDQYDPDLLLAAVEGELTPSQKRQIDQIRAADPRVARLLDSLIADRKAMRQLPDPTPPHWIMDEVDRQLERDMLVGPLPTEQNTHAIRQQHVLRRIMVYGAVAAMLAVVATVIVSSLWHRGDMLATNPPDNSRPITPIVPSDQPTPPDSGLATGDKPKGDGVATSDKPGPSTVVAIDPLDAGPTVVDADRALALAAEAARDPQRLADLFPSPGPVPVASVDAELAKLYGHVDGDPDAPGLPDPTFGNVDSGTRMKLLPKLPGDQRDPTRPATSDTEPTPESSLPDPAAVTPGSTLSLSTTDRAAAVQAIERIVADAGGARASDKPAGATIAYRIPRSRLDAVVNAIRAAMPVTVTPPRRPATPPLDAAPWPTLVPDYLAILRQQLPGVEVADDPRAEPMIDLPVTVTETPAE